MLLSQLSARTRTEAVEFTSAGSWTVPVGVYHISTFTVGGGGAGAWPNYASVGGSGGNGGWQRFAEIDVTPGTVLTITLGAGGSAPTAAGGSGGSGGTTSIVSSSGTSVFF